MKTTQLVAFSINEVFTIKVRGSTEMSGNILKTRAFPTLPDDSDFIME